MTRLKRPIKPEIEVTGHLHRDDFQPLRAAHRANLAVWRTDQDAVNITSDQPAHQGQGLTGPSVQIFSGFQMQHAHFKNCWSNCALHEIMAARNHAINKSK